MAATKIYFKVVPSNLSNGFLVWASPAKLTPGAHCVEDRAEPMYFAFDQTESEAVANLKAELAKEIAVDLEYVRMEL